jgi:hypothetical protein
MPGPTYLGRKTGFALAVREKTEPSRVKVNWQFATADARI